MKNLKNVPELHTGRMILREIEEQDASEIVRWRDDPEVYRYFKSPHQITMEEHLNWYQHRYLSNPDRLDWIGVVAEDGRKAGVFGLAMDEDTAEVSYLLEPETQHRGYAAEAVKELLCYAFSQGIRRVIAEIHRENDASLKLVNRLGFRLLKGEGDFLTYGIEEEKSSDTDQG